MYHLWSATKSAGLNSFLWRRLSDIVVEKNQKNFWLFEPFISCHSIDGIGKIGCLIEAGLQSAGVFRSSFSSTCPGGIELKAFFLLLGSPLFLVDLLGTLGFICLSVWLLLPNYVWICGHYHTWAFFCSCVFVLFVGQYLRLFRVMLGYLPQRIRFLFVPVPCLFESFSCFAYVFFVFTRKPWLYKKSCSLSGPCHGDLILRSSAIWSFV